MTRIIRTFFSYVSVMICFLSAAAATVYSQPQEYKEYTVKSGDTLWNISSKEVSDPFLWPKIWKENPEIKNPDLIYPGQTVRIPLRLTQKEASPPSHFQPVQPEAKKVIEPIPLPVTKPQQPVIKKQPEAAIRPVEKEYLVDMDALIASGYISDTVESSGEILASSTERSALGGGDYAYVRTLKPVSAGNKFYVIRSLGKVKHPETGAMMGYLIDVIGIVEVVGKESGETKAKITSSYDGILPGDLLSDFHELEQPFMVDSPRAPEINGVIVATKKKRIMSGMLNIVYIDKGLEDGLEVGDILGTMSKNQYTVPNGSMQIISIRDKTAAAIVRASQKEIFAGDIVVPAAEVRSTANLVSSQPPDDSMESAVNSFISHYVRAYESGDIDRFMSFYSTSAVENSSLRYEEIRRAYEKNFRDNRFSYILKDIQARKDDSRIMLTGTYVIKKLQGDASGTETRGNITWVLGREGGVLKIIRADYDRV